MSAPAPIPAAFAPDRMDRFYAGLHAATRFWLWFFFRAVGLRHPERVPAAGPVLLCINHPNKHVDSLVLAAALRRKVHFLGTATLFRRRLVARFLRACGVIPVYRRQDDPAQAERNTEMFAACFRAFDEGRMVGIYPEGTTHAEPRVQRIRTGAARLALGYEAARPRALTVIPVGLTFEARKSFRGRVLVSFGPPVPLHGYLRAYVEDPAKAVDALTRDLQWAMEAEVVHVDRIDDARLVRAVEELYRDELARQVRESRGLAPRQVDPVRLSRSIVEAVAHFKAREPARVELLWHRIQAYRALLARHRLRDDAVKARQAAPRGRRRLVYSWDVALGLPVFAYGALVNALPYFLPRALAHRAARGRETEYMTYRFLSAVVAFPLFWGLETWLVWRLAGAGWALAFFASLPVSGLLAYRYLVGALRLRGRLRFDLLALRHEAAARWLVAERAAILAELERAKDDYLAATRGSSF